MENMVIQSKNMYILMVKSFVGDLIPKKIIPILKSLKQKEKLQKVK